MIILEAAVSTAKQVADLQFQIDKLTSAVIALKPSTFKEYVATLIPIIAVLGTIIVSVWIPNKMFNKNRDLDREKRKENIKREEQLLFAELYGDLIGLNDRIITAIISMNFHKIRSNYYNYVVYHLPINQRAEQQQLFKISYDAYLHEASQVLELQQKYVGKLGQFAFLRPQTNIIGEYNKLSSINFMYSYIADYDNVTDNNIEEYNQSIIDEATAYVVKNIKVRLDETISIFAKDGLTI